MKIEPSVDKVTLLKRLRQEYELEIEQLTFLPKGEASNNYLAVDTSGKHYLLKLLGDSRLEQKGTRQLDIILPLLWCLKVSGRFTRLPCPLRTRGGTFSTDAEGWRLAVFPFIAGHTLEGRWPYSDNLRAALAATTARIHQSTAHVPPDFPRVETFDLPFADVLRTGLDALGSIIHGDRPGRQQLKALVLPHRAAILGYLKRLEELQSLARSIPRTRILCHTDLTPGNLLLDEQGELWILDWEGAMLAPPEHDLFFFAGEHFPKFFARYVQEYGPVHLDSDLFGFYFYRRNLEDLADWIIRILYENTHAEQDQGDLEGIRADCMNCWPAALEAAMEQVASQLDVLGAHGQR